MTNNEFDFVKDVGLQWSRKLTKLKNLDTIVIHHSASDGSTIYSIHHYHQSEGHAGCDYNYVITADGVIYKGRGLIYEGGHVGNAKSNYLNAHSCGICIVGAIHKHPPTDAQVASAKKLISAILALNGQMVDGVAIQVGIIYGHREVPFYVNGKPTGKTYPTICPGKYMPLDEFKALMTGAEAPKPEPVAELPAFFAYAGATGVNVRNGPGEANTIVGKLSAGERCVVLSSENGWSRVILLDQKPIIAGYCMDKYLEEKDESDPPGLFKYFGGSYVNLRTGPGIAYEKTGKVYAKDEVLVLQAQDGWAEVIKYNETPVLRGWCTQMYLRGI